jgi:cytochrome b subunit of formate dehydrogenase
LAFPVSIILELCTVLPHLHQGTDNPFCLLALEGMLLVWGRLILVNFWPTPSVLQVFTKAWLLVPYTIAVVGIGVIDLVRALRQQVID